MEYSVGEAARLVQRNKSTILRAIQAGKLSATRLADNSLSIDASELARVFDLRIDDPLRGTASLQPAAPQTALAAPAPSEPAAVEMAVLRARLEAAEALVAREREMAEAQISRERETYQETVADLRKRLDRSEERVLALSAQVAQPAPQPAQERPSEAPAASELSKASKGFLARLLGL